MSINFRTGEQYYTGQEAEKIMFPEVKDAHSFEVYLDRKEKGLLSPFLPALVEVMSQQPDMSNRPFGLDLCKKMSEELGLDCIFVTSLHSDLDYGNNADGVIIVVGKTGRNFILRIDLTTDRDKAENDSTYNKYVLFCNKEVVGLVDGINKGEISRDVPEYTNIINHYVQKITTNYDHQIREHTGGLKNG